MDDSTRRVSDLLAKMRRTSSHTENMAIEVLPHPRKKGLRDIVLSKGPPKVAIVSRDTSKLINS